MFAGGVGGAGVDALCTILFVRGCVCWEVLDVLDVLDVVDVLDVPEVMRFVLLCILEAVEGMRCSLEVLEVPEVMGFCRDGEIDDQIRARLIRDGFVPGMARRRYRFTDYTEIEMADGE